MNIKNSIISLFRKSNKFVPYPHATDIGAIEPAFNVGGITYYNFADESRMPISRFFEASDLMDLLSSRMSRERLVAHCEYIRDACNRGQMSKIIIANDNLLQNLSGSLSPLILMQIASVVYFDATENLYECNNSHNEIKIKRWIEADGLSFFLRIPIKKLVISKDISDEDLLGFLRIAVSETKLHTLKILEMCSSNDLPKETLKQLQWEVEILESLSN